MDHVPWELALGPPYPQGGVHTLCQIPHIPLVELGGKLPGLGGTVGTDPGHCGNRRGLACPCTESCGGLSIKQSLLGR